MIKYYKIANVVISLEGKENSNYYLESTFYFACKEIEAHEADIQISIMEVPEIIDEFKPEYYSLSGTISFNINTFLVKTPEYIYEVQDLFDKNRKTVVKIAPIHSTTGTIRRKARLLFGHRVGDHSKESEFICNITNYSCLWYIIAISLMKKQSAFVHCGMVSKNKEGLILTGTSGCGKTSTMIELIDKFGYKYMAEDFGIINELGYLYDMQKKAVIHSSDVKWGNRFLLGAVKKLKPFDKIEWKIKEKIGINAFYDFLPSDIFGELIEHKSKISNCFFLKRTKKGTRIVCNEISSIEMADMMKTASFREIKELYNIIGNIRSVGGMKYYKSYPSIEELEYWYLDIAKKSLRGVNCAEIEIPLNVDPNDTAEALIYWCNKNGN